MGLELSPKNAVWNVKLEHELRTLSRDIAQAVYYADSDREKIMDKVESITSCSIYPHTAP